MSISFGSREQTSFSYYVWMGKQIKEQCIKLISLYVEPNTMGSVVAWWRALN